MKGSVVQPLKGHKLHVENSALGDSLDHYEGLVVAVTEHL